MVVVIFVFVFVNVVRTLLVSGSTFTDKSDNHVIAMFFDKQS